MVSCQKMVSRLPGENSKEIFYFFELLPVANLGMETCNQDISKISKASSFTFHPLYPMIQPNFYIEELIQNTSRARMDSDKLTMF